jgi:predicted SAM-dependent methyltransferase
MSRLKSVARALIPKDYHRFVKGTYQVLRFAGNRFRCPCCNGHFRRLLPYGTNLRPNAKCPRCGSLERHRLLWLYLKNRTNLFSDRLRVLHFAPEPVFQNILRSTPNLDYLSADLDPSKAMVKMDITNILFKDDSFDVLICNHVLEHIVNDRKGMRELFRVLKPGGWAILQSPMDITLEETFEDPAITSTEDRERFFGQGDHVRIYGRDYGDRLKQVGFTVKVDDYVKGLGSDRVKKHRLPVQDIYFCTKPELK